MVKGEIHRQVDLYLASIKTEGKQKVYKVFHQRTANKMLRGFSGLELETDNPRN